MLLLSLQKDVLSVANWFVQMSLVCESFLNIFSTFPKLHNTDNWYFLGHADRDMNFWCHCVSNCKLVLTRVMIC